MQEFFSGVATAMVTPFRGGNVDFHALEILILQQLKSGVDGLVVLGSTGEPTSLSDCEKEEIFRFFTRLAKGKTKLIFACGNPSLPIAVDEAKRAQDLGADGLLVVTPYYNKCTQSGIVNYYKKICRSVTLPVVAYNVPSRTGVNLLSETAKKLAEFPNFSGIKEATGDMRQILRTIYAVEKKCAVYSGDDALTLPVLSCGGRGVISVLSNLLPTEIKKLYSFVQSGNLQEAQTLSNRLSALSSACFLDSNPIPVKCALALCGYIENELRPPLTKLKRREEKILSSALRNFYAEVKA